MGAQDTIGGQPTFSVTREGGAPALRGNTGVPISPTERQAQRAPRRMTLGRRPWLYMRPSKGDAISRKARRRWLFLRSAPDLGVWRPGISGPRYFPIPARRSHPRRWRRPHDGKSAISCARRAGRVLEKGTGPTEAPRFGGFHLPLGPART